MISFMIPATRMSLKFWDKYMCYEPFVVSLWQTHVLCPTLLNLWDNQSLRKLTLTLQIKKKKQTNDKNFFTYQRDKTYSESPYAQICMLKRNIVIKKSQFPLTIMFSGLRSWWTMSLECRWSSPSHIPTMIVPLLAGVICVVKINMRPILGRPGSHWLSCLPELEIFKLLIKVWNKLGNCMLKYIKCYTTEDNR